MTHEGTDARTVPRHSPLGLAPRPPLPRFRIAVVQGVDVGAFLLCDESRPARALIGQSASCDLRLADRMVSRRHLAVQVDNEGLHLTDLESTNGTHVGGLRLREVWLRGGEIIAIGNTLLRIDRLEPGAPVVLSDAVRFGGMLGASLEMRRLYPLCERLAGTDLTVVIEGETGTGKEVLAESLHAASTRADRPFIIFDCGATPPALIESALFGHERGAFTGANAARRGAFEEANGGTLFLDEMGELPLTVQPKLLRALERAEVQRVGSNEWIHVDVRVIVATRRDLDREVQEGRFREDLYYRLAVGRIELPPLRERHGDITLLARHLWRELGGGDTPLPTELTTRLESWHWPGNIRELGNAIGRYIALGDVELSGGIPQAAEDSFESVLAQQLPLARARQKVVEAFERRYIEIVLARHGGNVSRAATSSGLARRYFQILRARYDKAP